jgi:hypothetical protein
MIHTVIQVAMGWHNAHRYQFNMGRPYASDSIQLFFEDDDDFDFLGKYDKFDAQKMKLNDYFGAGRER